MRNAKKQIMRRIWRWISHTVLNTPDSLTCISLNWNLQRSRILTKLTWRLSVRRELANSKITWNGIKNTVLHHVRWRELVELLCFEEELKENKLYEEQIFHFSMELSQYFQYFKVSIELHYRTILMDTLYSTQYFGFVLNMWWF